MIEKSHPWVSGDLLITSESLTDMHHHAVTEYPNECCGYASGPSIEPRLVDTSVPMQNLASSKEVSATLPAGRNSETYFVMNPLELDVAMGRGEQDAHPVKVVYHSHPNSKGAYFSDEDRTMFGEDHELLLPVSFIVIGVGTEQVISEPRPYVIETKLWVFDALSKQFKESTLTVL